MNATRKPTWTKINDDRYEHTDGRTVIVRGTNEATWAVFLDGWFLTRTSAISVLNAKLHAIEAREYADMVRRLKG